MTAPNLIRINSLDDPRVAAYHNLRDRTLRGQRMFVAEGTLLVLRLLQSRFAAESLLVAEPLFAEFLPHVPAGVPIYVAAEPLLQAIIGFPLHQGVLAAGCRRPEMPLEEMLGPPGDRPLGVIVCPRITKPENMGLIFRVAAGLGADGLLLGPQCCDPFSAAACGCRWARSCGLPIASRRSWPRICTRFAIVGAWRRWPPFSTNGRRRWPRFAGPAAPP